jgi:hypothetical protein
MAILAPLSCFFLYKKPDLGMIINSAFIGSYLVVRGIAQIVGPDLFDVPNEFTVGDQVRVGALDGIPWEFYPFFGGVIVFTLMATYLQHREFKQESFDYVHFYHLL